MIRTVRRALALAGALAGALAAAGLAVATPAHASINDCQTGRACLWSHAYYNGTGQANPQFFQWPSNVSQLPSWIDNQASSARNNGTSCRADFYTGPGFTGQVLTMHLQDHRDNLQLDPRADGGTWNDVISSLKWVCPDN